MVQTDISQLSRECNQWREQLHSFRDEFNELKRKLLEAASHAHSKEDQTELDHYQNQFHIQLINIHDLKQLVKAHDKKVHFEVTVKGEQVSEQTLANHEHLHDEFISLKETLGELKNDFNRFIGILLSSLQ
jgi:chromosome segregation ATPase